MVLFTIALMQTFANFINHGKGYFKVYVEVNSSFLLLKTVQKMDTKKL